MKKFLIVMLGIAIMLGVGSCTEQNNTYNESTAIPIEETTSPSIEPEIADSNLSEDIQTNVTTTEYDDVIYIGNKNTKKFHNPDCRTLPAEKNRVEFTSRTKAINAGYSPCGNCRP